MTGPQKVLNRVANISSIYVDVSKIAGVVADGVTNCYASLQAAINAATDLTTFYFPASSNFYQIEGGTLVLKQNIILLGDGPQVSRLRNGNASSFKFPIVDTGAGSGVELRGLGFIYRGQNDSGIAGNRNVVKVQCVSGFRFVNCAISVATLQAVAPNELTALACNNWYSPLSSAPATSDYQITDNTFTPVGNVLNIELNANSGSIIYGNTVGSGSGSNDVDIYGCSQCVISDNVFNAQLYIDSSADSIVKGNSISTTTGPSLVVDTNCNSIILQGNRVTSIDAVGIDVAGQTNLKISVVDNIVNTTSGDFGIYSGGDYTVIQGNIVNGPSSGTQATGIGIDADFCNISGNIVKSSAKFGVSVCVDSVSGKSNTVSMNTLVDCNPLGAAAITGKDLTHSSFVGNNISYTTTDYPDYGLQLTGAASVTNSMVGNVTVGFNTAATLPNTATNASNI